MEKGTVLLIKTGLVLNVGLPSVENTKNPDIRGTTGPFLGLAKITSQYIKGI